MSLWLTILLAGAVTYAIRLSFIFLMDRLPVPPWFRRALRLVPIAVLSAIIVPDLATYQGTITLNPLTNPQLPAGMVAAFVAWRTRRVLPTIVAGFAALLLIEGALRFLSA